jgi:hypothetical protein
VRDVQPEPDPVRADAPGWRAGRSCALVAPVRASRGPSSRNCAPQGRWRGCGPGAPREGLRRETALRRQGGAEWARQGRGAGGPTDPAGRPGRSRALAAPVRASRVRSSRNCAPQAGLRVGCAPRAGAARRVRSRGAR